MLNQPVHDQASVVNESLEEARIPFGNGDFGPATSEHRRSTLPDTAELAASCQFLTLPLAATCPFARPD